MTIKRKQIEHDDDFCFSRKKVTKVNSNNTKVSAQQSNTKKVEPKTPEQKLLNMETLSVDIPLETPPSALQDRRKTRKSLAARSKRQSSYGSLVMPHPSIDPVDFHKHVSVDFPGPIRMKQMLIWATQSAMEQTRNSKLKETGSKLVEALSSSKIDTSWYQRKNHGYSPAQTNALPNPINQEMKEIMEQDLKDLDKLEKEKEEWNQLLETYKLKKLKERQEFLTKNDIDLLESVQSTDSLDVTEWLKEAEAKIDNLDYSLKVTQKFASQSQQFCENVFHQIFTQFFSKTKEPKTDPLTALRALSRARK